MTKLIVSKNNMDLDSYPGYIITSNIGEEYNCKTVHKPFFKKIIIIDKGINDYDLKRIYNMCLVNGIIYFKNEYKKFFSNITNISQSKMNEFFCCTKPDNKIFIFPARRSVDFIIVGVQRAGTTSMSHNLSKHPDLFIDPEKDPRKSEIHFFDLNWSRGLDWYKRKFDYKYKMVGEKTPDLFSLEHTFPLIQRVNPYVKLIVILKNPILRAYSSWKMVSNYFNETRSFEECVMNERPIKNKTFHTMVKQYLQRGLYYKQLKRLKRWFPKQNILILFDTDMESQPNIEYKKIYEFLGVKNIKGNYEYIHKSNDKTTMTKELYNSLIPYFEKDVGKLEQHLKIDLNWLEPRT